MANNQRAFELLSSTGSKSSIVSQRSLPNDHRPQQSEYKDYDLPPDYYKSETFLPDTRATRPSIYAHNDDPLDDSFDECSDSDDDQATETHPMRKSALNSFKRLTKLGKKNSSDVPLLGDADGHSRAKSFVYLQPLNSSASHHSTTVQHASNEYVNIPRKMKAGISHSSPYINWSSTSATTSQ